MGAPPVPPLSRHAAARMQQRGIGADALACLLDFGAEHFDHQGGVMLYFDRRARSRLARALGGRLPPGAGRIVRCYAVLSTGGEVITVGHRYRRINRN